MKYIRTTGTIVDTEDMHPTTLQWYKDTKMIREADTIEELIMPGDLVEIGGYVMEVAHAFWSEDKTIGIARPKECDDTRIYSYDIDNVRRLYIPNGNDYKLVAIHHNRRFDDLETIKEKGEWELLWKRN